MARIDPCVDEYQRRRWMRPDAHRFLRPDIRRFLKREPHQTHEEFERFCAEMERLAEPPHVAAARAAQERAAAAAEELERERFEQEVLALRAALHDLKRELAGLPPLTKYRPDQPRVPSGNPDGGQWTGGGGAGGAIGGATDGPVLSDATPDNDWKPGAQYAQARPPRGTFPGATPAQHARYEFANARAQEALNRVREIDPNWRPTPSAYETVEGAIRARETEALEAQARVAELQRNGIGPGPHARESIPAVDQSATLPRWNVAKIMKMDNTRAVTHVEISIRGHVRAITCPITNRRPAGILTVVRNVFIPSV